MQGATRGTITITLCTPRVLWTGAEVEGEGEEEPAGGEDEDGGRVAVLVWPSEVSPFSWSASIGPGILLTRAHIAL
jgi:hypothetical protein